MNTHLKMLCLRNKVSYSAPFRCSSRVLEENGFDDAEHRGEEAQLQPINIQGRVQQNRHCPTNGSEECSFSQASDSTSFRIPSDDSSAAGAMNVPERILRVESRNFRVSLRGEVIAVPASVKV